MPTPANSAIPSNVTQLMPQTAVIRPWVDPIVDQRGHDPRSAYVERYWLSVIGPTATWIMRRFADCFDDQPQGFDLDLAHTATTMGLSFKRGNASPFGKALHRCVMFGLVQARSDGFDVRRKLPSVPHRHLKRLPTDVQATHDDWIERIVRFDRSDVERQLRAAGVPPSAAALATEAVALAS